MTREEFARIWLSPGVAAAQEVPPAGRARLTDAATRVFKERAPEPSRLIQMGRSLRKWSLLAAAGGALFFAMAGLLLKLGPYVSQYAATYLSAR